MAQWQTLAATPFALGNGNSTLGISALAWGDVIFEDPGVGIRLVRGTYAVRGTFDITDDLRRSRKDKIDSRKPDYVHIWFDLVVQTYLMRAHSNLREHMGRLGTVHSL